MHERSREDRELSTSVVNMERATGFSEGYDEAYDEGLVADTVLAANEGEIDDLEGK